MVAQELANYHQELGLHARATLMSKHLVVLYASADRLLYQEFHKHLSLLQQDGTFSIWHPDAMQPGQEIEVEIEQQLRRADLILLLLSADFLSDFGQLTDQLAASVQVIVPFLLRPCAWRQSSLHRLKLLPTNQRALTEWINRDSAFVEASQALRQLVHSTGSLPPPTQDQDDRISRAVTPQFLSRWRAVGLLMISIFGIAAGIHLLQRQKRLAACDDIVSDEASCKRADPTSCAKVFQCYERRCNNESIADCVNLGILYETGIGTSLNKQTAYAYFKRACEADHLDGCFYLAQLYQAGQATPKDEQRAYIIYQKLCDKKLAKACNNIGRIYEEGTIVERNEATASQYYKQACDMKYQLGCTNLGTLYAFGKQALQDLNQGFSLLNVSCIGGVGLACSNFGLFYERGLTVVQDYDTALELYTKGCALKDGLGCFNAGQLLEGVKNQPREAVAFYQKSCEMGNRYGCINLAVTYEEGKFLTKDIAAAEKLYYRVCEEREPLGCFNLGNLYEEQPQRDPEGQRKLEYYRRSCDMGLAAACKKAQRAND